MKKTVLIFALSLFWLWTNAQEAVVSLSGESTGGTAIIYSTFGETSPANFTATQFMLTGGVNQKGTTVVYAGEDRESCENTVVLSAADPAPYFGYWKKISAGGGTIADNTSLTTTATNIALGKNEYAWVVDIDGTEVADTLTINYVQLSTFAGADKTESIGSTVLEAADASPYTGKWHVYSGGAAILDPTLHNSNAYLGYGENILVWEIFSESCSASDTVVINSTNKTGGLIAHYDFEGSANDQTLNSNDGVPEATTSVPDRFGMPDGSFGFDGAASNVKIPWNESFRAQDFSIVSWVKFNDVPNIQTIFSIPSFSDEEYAVSIFAENQAGEMYFGSFFASLPNLDFFATFPYDQNYHLIAFTKQEDRFKLYLDGAVMSEITAPGLIDFGAPRGVLVGALDSKLSDFETDSAWLNGDIDDLKYFARGLSGPEILDMFEYAFVADAGADVAACAPSVTLNAQDPSPYAGEWTSLNGKATVADPTLFNSVANDLVQGENLFEWTVYAYGEYQRDTVLITKNCPATYAGSDMEACSDTILLAADDPAPFYGQWKVLEGTGMLTDPTYFGSEVTELSAGVNKFEWSVQIDQEEFKDTVVVIQNAVEAYAGSDTSFWSGGQTNPEATYQLNADPTTSPALGSWTSSVTGITFVDETLFNSIAENLVPGVNTFYWTVKDGGCEAVDSINVFNRMTIKSAADGLWGNGSSWSPAFVPSQYDSVIVVGNNITVDGIDARFYRLIIGTGGNITVSGIVKANGSMRGGTVVIEQDIEKSYMKLFSKSKNKANNATLNIKRGGTVVIEQDIEKGIKAAGNGLRVRSGGTVVIEQDIEKEAGNAHLQINPGCNIYLGGVNPNLTDPSANFMIGRGGTVVIEQDIEKSTNTKVSASTAKLGIGTNGSMIIDQNAVQAEAAMRIRGGGTVVIEQDIEKASSGNGGQMRLRGGTVVIEQDIEKKNGAKVVNGTMVVARGGTVVIEQDIEKSKLGIDGFLETPKLRISGGTFQIGDATGTQNVSKGKLKSGHVVIEQNIEKETTSDAPSFVIGAGGSLDFYDIPEVINAYLELGANATATFLYDAVVSTPIPTDPLNVIPTVVVDESASLIDESPEGALTSDIIRVSQSFGLSDKLISPPLSGIPTSLFTDADFSTWDEANHSWADITSPISLQAMNGYKVKSSVEENVTYIGDSYTGEFDVALANTVVSDMNLQGWNLVGNPFMSAIDWELVTTNGVNQAMYSYNPVSQNFGVYLKGGLSLNDADQFISVAEAVFVKATEGETAPSVGLTNKSKIHHVSGLFTEQPKMVFTDGLKLNVSGAGFADETAIFFDETAALDFEADKDAYKLKSLNSNAPQLYVYSYNDEDLSVMTVPFPEKEMYIPIHFKAGIDGSYQITVPELGMSMIYNLFLYDFKTGLNHDLSTQPTIEISASTTDDPNRFVLGVVNTTATDIDDNNSNEISIFVYGNELFVNTKNGENYVVELFNTIGQKVWENSSNSQISNQIPNDLAKGVYIVRIVTGQKQFVQKIQLK